MLNKNKKVLFFLVFCTILLTAYSCSNKESDNISNANDQLVNQADSFINQNNNININLNENLNNSNSNTSTDLIKIIFLHHSTGENIWNGGVPEWFDNWNTQNGTNYQIEEMDFPTDVYGWENYPYDYWKIWSKSDITDYFMEQPTLKKLTADYDVIVWKHCYPVSEIIESNMLTQNVVSKTIQNYKIHYDKIKEYMKGYPNTKFIAWTPAVQTSSLINEGQASRTKEFADWVRYEWDEQGDNIFIWDFYHWETDGGLYMKDAYAEDPTDPHPNASFSESVAKYFAQRVVSVIEGNGDITNIIGK